MGLIGPNGAGKTTLVNLVTAVYGVTRGRILFDGQRIDGLKSHEISRQGIARTFQIVQPFPKMTVCENVAAGALFAGGARTLHEAKERALEHLRFVGLADLADQSASALTLANRKRLELAKSLAMKPKLLLLDEVNAGLNNAEINKALTLIRSLAERGHHHFDHRAFNEGGPGPLFPGRRSAPRPVDRGRGPHGCGSQPPGDRGLSGGPFCEPAAEGKER